jgi:uncharacterized protein (DUF433 family)
MVQSWQVKRLWMLRMIGPGKLDQRFTRDPHVLGGKPVIRGMRVPVSLIVDFIENGDTIEDVLDAYPALTREDIEAALAYAART